jgi:putative aminopeptidase FrvX
MERIYELACAFSGLHAVSGQEYTGMQRVAELCEGYFDSYEVTPVGSFIGRINSKKEGAKTLLLDAHIDEIGFIVSEICEGGLLKVVNIGGIDPRILSASEVNIYGKKTITGIFTSKPPHLQEPGELDKPMKLEDLAIDTGYSKEQLEEIVSIGTPVGYRSPVVRLQGGYIAGKSFDDRICAVSILRALEMLKDKDLPVNIAVVFSGGEETGYKGAATSSYQIAPDFAICLDVTNAYVPDAPVFRKDIKMGGGASISYSAQTSRALTIKTVETAKKNGIPYQLFAEPNHTGTNSGVIQTSHGGIPTVLISIPLKNMHTANEVVTLSDVYETSRLISELVLSLKEGI